MQDVKIKGGKENWVRIEQRESGAEMPSPKNPSQYHGKLQCWDGLLPWTQVALGRTLGEIFLSHPILQRKFLKRDDN